MPVMRAKMSVNRVEPYTPDGSSEPTQITLSMNAVCSDESFGPNGESENNTYSRWTPSADITLCITNPVLFDQFKVGEEYYLDFTKAGE